MEKRCLPSKRRQVIVFKKQDHRVRCVTRNNELDGGDLGTCNADGRYTVSIIVTIIMNVEHYLNKYQVFFYFI